MSYRAELEEALRDFSESHKDWDIHRYLFSPSTELRDFLRGLLTRLEGLHRILEHGTEEDMDTLLSIFSDSDLAKFSTVCLTVMLDALHTRERLQQPFSKSLVAWYRTCGWQFPQFAFELMEAQAQEAQVQEESEEEEEVIKPSLEPVTVIRDGYDESV